VDRPVSAAARPLPELTGLVGEFHELLATGTLHLQHCDACDRWWYPAKLLCPGGADHDLQWRPARGTGSLFSWTVTHQALHPAFAADVPYVTALVAMDDGPRLVGRLHGVEIDDVHTDDRVQLQVDVVDGVSIVAFVR
jgi:uncharacterized OB-fold protein